MEQEAQKNISSLRIKIKRKDNDEVIELLKKYGVDIMIYDIGTPLNLACLFENWEIADFCIKHGANVNHRDNENNTPLIRVSKFGNTEIVEKLINAGANVNAQDKYDKTALAKAISNNPINYELIELLLKNGADSTIIENYMKEDPRKTSHSAYDYAINEIKDTKLITLLNNYK